MEIIEQIISLITQNCGTFLVLGLAICLLSLFIHSSIEKTLFFVISLVCILYISLNFENFEIHKATVNCSKCIDECK